MVFGLTVPNIILTQLSKKANAKLGLIKHTFTSLDEKSMKLLYTSLVRPHLEYAFQIWNPYYDKDIKLVENVPKIATKICFPKGVSYEKRLEKMNLTNLVDRRLRGDLIQMFILIIDNIDKISWDHEPETIGITPRGHDQN
jgi:ribonuclease P/MRP protein subunit RPP40